MNILENIGMQNATRNVINEQMFVVRGMFYLLSPNETYFERIEEVPDIRKLSGNWFIGFMVIEQILFIIKHGRFNGTIADSITSLANGMVYGLPELFSRSLIILTYEWVYQNWRIFEMQWDSPMTYIVTALVFDMLFYWFHRAAHELSIFWAAHQTHHSSEEYTLSTALRQSLFQQYIAWIFYLPLAFFVRPSIFIIHSHMNLVYQFWIHTEIIDNLGPLEYILNTPSHHRVHHGRNPYCIDKNYAGVLIIWDRMFGTFAPERKSEELAYGLVHPVETFDPLTLQLFNYEYVIKRFLKAPLCEKFSVLFKGPGWMPGTGRLGNHEDLPKVQYPIIKKEKSLTSYLQTYVLLNFAFLLLIYGEYSRNFQVYPTIVSSFFTFMVLYSLTCFGMFFDHKKSAVYYDILRCAVNMFLLINYKSELKKLVLNSNELYWTFFVINSISLLTMGVMSIKNLTGNSNLKPIKTE